MRNVYADYNASCPCLPEVAEGVAHALCEHYANPSARHHLPGRQAAELRETARANIASLISAETDEIIFTSGATEAINQAIIGVMSRSLPSRPKMLIAATEHEAVRASAQACADAGAELVIIPVDDQGIIDIAFLSHHCDSSCALVAVMLANNETGLIQDIIGTAHIAHSCGALMLCDASQALGKIPFSVRELGCDLLTLSGHKCYAPKGVGVLFKRRGIAIDALIHGGQQEQNLRSGTENIPAIHGFGIAAEWLSVHGEALRQQLNELTQQLELGLKEQFPDCIIHADKYPRIPGTCMLSLPSAAKTWLRRISLIACSPGSSCASGQGKGSHVLAAMGFSEELANNSLRLSLGHFTKPEDIMIILEHLKNTAN